VGVAPYAAVVGETREHWDHVWQRGRPDQMSWFQSSAEPCRTTLLGVTTPGSTVVVMGAGRSSLVPALLADRRSVIAVDISPAAVHQLRETIGDHPNLSTVVADGREFVPAAPVDAWHDRAVFHFLVDEEDRAAYVRCVTAGVRRGGHLVIATFAPHGPETCSGLPVRRHDAVALAAAFAPGFEPVASTAVDHHTPWGSIQPFTHLVLRRW
jgi:hypothetical protein